MSIFSVPNPIVTCFRGFVRQVCFKLDHYIHAILPVPVEVPQGEMVLQVYEYQLTLYYLSDWNPRMSGVTRWINTINNSQYIFLNEDEFSESFHNRTRVDSYNCNASPNYYTMDVLSDVIFCLCSLQPPFFTQKQFYVVTSCFNQIAI